MIEFSLDHETEARSMLVEQYKDSYGERTEHQVDLLMTLGGYQDRFDYLRSILGDALGSLTPILISGYAAGSEMIVARKFGFREIHGVEVDRELLAVTEARLADFPDMFPRLYDGRHLPYDDKQFDLVVSGHIIEHTESPQEYLRESMRVLEPGGILYLEFPTRYHYIELHTGLFSFEWLPTTLRNLMLGLVSSRFSPLNSQIKARYAAIRSTQLRQVSRRDILHWLKQMGIECEEIAHAVPVPGIVRCIIRKR